MNHDGQTYMRCEDCGEFVNSSEEGAHKCFISDQTMYAFVCLKLRIGRKINELRRDVERGDLLRFELAARLQKLEEELEP
jgi:hypothetical protein